MPFEGRGREPRSPWTDFLLGTLLLAACFLSLCAYAAHQRRNLHPEAAAAAASPMARR